MNCIDSVLLPYSVTIKVPEGFYYNDENQLSVAVSTDDLNLYVVEESFRTNDLKNPCTGENINDALVVLKQVRMSGTLAFRMALNALISSYNFILGTQANVNDDGWSSVDELLPIKVMEGLEERDYIVVGYLDPSLPTVLPTKEDIKVVIKSFNVAEHPLTKGSILEITGAFSFIVNM